MINLSGLLRETRDVRGVWCGKCYTIPVGAVGTVKVSRSFSFRDRIQLGWTMDMTQYMPC